MSALPAGREAFIAVAFSTSPGCHGSSNRLSPLRENLPSARLGASSEGGLLRCLGPTTLFGLEHLSSEIHPWPKPTLPYHWRSGRCRGRELECWRRSRSNAGADRYNRGFRVVDPPAPGGAAGWRRTKARSMTERSRGDNSDGILHPTYRLPLVGYFELRWSDVQYAGSDCWKSR
jgi:hypothetical protein